MNTDEEVPSKDVEKSPSTKQDVLKIGGYRETSFGVGMIHMFRGTVGTGILALPSAFNLAGYVGGSLAILIITYITNYCALILARCQRELGRRCKNDRMTYQATVDAAFKEGPTATKNMASFFTKWTNGVLIFSQIGGISTYIVFVAENIKQILDEYFGERSLREYILWITPIILLINMAAKLRKIALVSLFGNIVILMSIVVIFYYTTQDLPPLEDRNMFGRAEDVPFYVGTIFFASGCISLVLPLQNDLKQPERMTTSFGLLNINATLTGVLYLVFGLLGYLKYGSQAQKASITLNLPTSSVSAKLIQIFLSISTATITAIHTYITEDLIWEDYLKKRIKRTNLKQFVLRISIILSTVLCAMIVPNLGVLMSVIGIVGQCTLLTTMPCIIHILTNHQQPTIWSYLAVFYKDILVLLFNVFIFLFQMTNIVRNFLK